MTVPKSITFICAQCGKVFHPTSRWSLKARHPCCSRACRRAYTVQPEVVAEQQDHLRKKRQRYNKKRYGIHKKQYSLRYRLNRDKMRPGRNACAAAYRAAHPEKVRKTAAAWEAAHPEARRALNKRWRARKARAPINDLTAAQWEAMKIAYGYRCVYCGTKMQRLTQDHITPLSRGGSHTYTNIVPACRSCNSKKGVKAPFVPIQPLLLIVATERPI